MSRGLTSCIYSRDQRIIKTIDTTNTTKLRQLKQLFIPIEMITSFMATIWKLDHRDLISFPKIAGHFLLFLFDRFVISLL